MPKFYISDGVESTVLIADSPLQACFRAIQHRFQGVPVNGYYKVSELGFDNHDDDTVFSSGEVVEAFVEILEKRRKSQENPQNDEEVG